MQPINHNGGVILAPPQIDDRFLMVGLVLVCLTYWSNDIYSAQMSILFVAVFCALCFMMQDRLIAAIGVYLSGWYTYLYASDLYGTLPAGIGNLGAGSLQFFMSCLLIYGGIKHGRTSTDTWKDIISILAAVLSVIGLIQYVRVGTASATLGCTNFLGAFLAIGAFCAFRKGWVFLLPLILGCLWLTHTSTAIAAFCFGLGYFLWKWRGAALSIIPGAAYFFLIDNNTLGKLDRLSFWNDALLKLSGSWTKVVFGTGPGILWQLNNTLHSAPMGILWTIGLIGCVLAALCVIRVVKREISGGGDRALFSSFLAILVDGIGNNLFGVATTAYLAVIIFALNDRKLAEV